MKDRHEYTLEVEWTGNKGSGTSTYLGYERSHIVRIPGKTEINCSSDPSFRGDASKHNPEELFLASIATCHMLWFLHLCAEAGVSVTTYSDNPEGLMLTDADGGGRFTSVTLKPRVSLQNLISNDQFHALHKRANALCFIANSCNFPIQHQPLVVQFV